MEDIVTLGLAIDSGPAAGLNAELDKTAIVAANADRSTKALTGSTQALGTATAIAASGTERHAATMAAQAKGYDIADAAYKRAMLGLYGLVAAESAAERATMGHATAYANAAQQAEGFARAAQSAAAKQAEGFARAAQATMVETNRSLSRQLMASVEVSASSIKAMYAGASSGATTAATVIAAANAKIGASNAAVGYMGTPGQIGLNARQKVMLGYQLQDVFVTLAGGMSPLMVAAQQGPQISMLYGGVRQMIAAIPKPLLAAGGAALGIGITAAVLNSLAEANDRIAEQHRRLDTLLGSQVQAAGAYKDMSRFASDVGINVAAATEKFIAFGHATANLGATRQNISDVASTVEKLTQMSGANEAEGGSAQQAVVSMLKESTVSADQLKTVLATVPQIADKIAAGLGVSVTELRLMTQEGSLTNKQVFEALQVATAGVNAEFSKFPKSIGSTFSSLATDLSQIGIRLVNELPIIKEYRLVLEGAALAAKSLNQASKGETPQQVIARTDNLFTPSSNTNVLNAPSSERLAAEQAGTLAAQADRAQALRDLMAQLRQQERGADIAAIKAANEAVVQGVEVANKLDPFIAELVDFNKQTTALTDGLVELQKRFDIVSTATASQEITKLTNTLQLLRDKSLESKTAFGQALDAASLKQQQQELGLTPGQIATQGQVKTLTLSQPGVTTEAAQGVVSVQQGQMLDDMIKKQNQELLVQTAITNAMRGGKKAADEAAVAMQVLGIAFEQLGTITPELQVKLDVLTETLNGIREQARMQATIDASKPLTDDLAAIAAAMKVVEQGSFAMKRAEQEARSALNDNGTGALQLEVFDAQQKLTDAATIKNLKDQVELTNNLAAAAGNVAAQKKVQLDFDIKKAQMDAAPGSGAAIAGNMRLKAAADLTLETANGAAEIEKQVTLVQQETALIKDGSLTYAVQLAQLQKKTELIGKGVDLASDEAIRAVAASGALAKANVEKQYAQEAADSTKRIWQNAYDNIQTSVSDSLFNAFKSGVFSAKTAADTIKDIFFRLAADIATAMLIKPIIQPIFMAGQSAGVIPAGVGGTNGIGSGGGGSFGLGGLGGGAGGWMGNFGTWLNTPLGSPGGFGGGLPIEGPLQPGASPLGVTGGFTPLGGIGAAASIGMGAYTLLSGHGSTGSLLGGGASIAGGVASLAGMLLPALSSVLGPIGIGLGVLGAVLPSLLGPSAPEPPTNQAFGEIGFGSGKWQTSGGAWGPNANSSTSTGPLMALSSSMDSVFKSLGGVTDATKVWGVALSSLSKQSAEGTAQGWSVDQKTSEIVSPTGARKQWGQGSDPGLEQAGVAATLNSIFEGAVGDITDNMRLALNTVNQDGKGTFATLSTVVTEILNFDDTVKGLGKTVTSAESALKAVDDQFASLLNTADKYGLDTAQVDAAKVTARAKVGTDFADTIQRGLNDLKDGTINALADLDKEKQGVIDNNKFLLDANVGAQDQIVKIEELYGAKRVAIVEAGAQAAVQAAQDARAATRSYYDAAIQTRPTENQTTYAFYQSLQNLNDQFAGFYKNADQLGLTVDQIGRDYLAAFKKLGDDHQKAMDAIAFAKFQFFDNIAQQTKAITDPTGAANDNLARQRDLTVKSAQDQYGIGSPEHFQATIAAYTLYNAQMKAANDNFRAGLDAMTRTLEAGGAQTIENLMDQRAKDIAIAMSLDGPFFDGIMKIGANWLAAVKAWNAKVFREADDFKYSIDQGLLQFTNPLQAALNDNARAEADALATAKANNAAVSQIYSEQAAAQDARDQIRINDAYAIKYTVAEADKAGRALTDAENTQIAGWQNEAAAAQAASAVVSTALADTGNHYVSLIDVQTLYQQKALVLTQQFYDQSLSSINDLIKNLQYGPLSAATPQEHLAGVAGAYSAATAQLSANPYDQTLLQNFAAAGTDYATAIREFYGSTVEGAKQIMDVLQTATAVRNNIIAGTATANGTMDPQLIAALSEISSLTDQIAGGQEGSAALVAAVDVLTAELRRRLPLGKAA